MATTAPSAASTHAFDTARSVGETVAAGAALGGVGLRRGESVLYFELLQDGQPVAPAPWFGL